MRRALFTTVTLGLCAVVLWLALGMQHGLLLSGDIRSKVWPWAPYEPAKGIVAPALSDPLWQFVPWIELARRELGEGRLPLWNPHQDGGVPLLGNGQSALGSPLLWPALLLGATRGWNLALLARLLVALAGTFLWLRDRTLSRAAAVLGACCFALSGPFIAWLEHPHTLAAAPVPLLLLFAGRLAERPSGGAVSGTSLATYLVLAGGHPESALLAALLAAAVVSVRAPSPVAVLRCGAAALLGAGLAAPLLLPFLEYFRESSARFGTDRHPFVLPLRALARFVFSEVPGTHPIEAAAGVSLAVLALVPFAFRGRRTPETWLFAAAAALGLLVAYDNPLARLLARETPVYWTRVLLLLPLPLAFLAASGLDRLLARAGGRRAAGGVAALLALSAAVELLLATRGVHGCTPFDRLAPDTPLLARLRQEGAGDRVLPLHTFLPANSATLYGLDDPRGYDALAPRAWRARRQEIGRFGNAPTAVDVVEPWDLAAGGGGLDRWSTKYLLLHPQFRFGAETLNARLGLDLEEVYSGPDGRTLRNRRALPRVRWAEGDDAGIRIQERVSTCWRIEAESGRPRTLLLANPFFPGWRARVDGAPVPLAARTGEAIQVPLPAGRHVVEVAYRPASFRLGLVAAALSLLLLLGWARRQNGQGAGGSALSA